MPTGGPVDPEAASRQGPRATLSLTVVERRHPLRGSRVHRLCGTADLTLGEAVDAFREAGHDELADRLETDLVGRNILEGRWSYQVVEEYDDGYYAAFKAHEQSARDDLAGGERHVFEARMKEDRRTHGRRHHEGSPASGA